MRYGQLTLERARPAGLFALGIRFFLAAALTASQTPGGYAPFSLGLIAAAGPGAGGTAALAGAAAGAFLLLDFADALPFLAAGLLILTASTAFRDTWLSERRWFPSLSAAGLSLAVGGIYVLQSLSPLDKLMPYIAASGLAGISAWFLQPLFSPEGNRPAPEGILFLSGALFLALADLEILEVSIGRTFLCALLAYTAYERGPLTGAAVGLGAGLTADLCAENGGGLFAAAYGLAGLLAGSRTGGRRAWAALAFFGAALLALLPAEGEAAGSLLLEMTAGTALFLLLPGRLFGGKRIKRSRRAEQPGPPGSLRQHGPGNAPTHRRKPRRHLRPLRGKSLPHLCPLRSLLAEGVYRHLQRLERRHPLPPGAWTGHG